MTLRQWAVAFLLTLAAALATIFGTVAVQAHPHDNSDIAQPTLESAGLTVEQLADGVYGLLASTDFPVEDPNAAICNGGIVIGDDGVLVIDAFQNEALASLMFDTVASLTDQPIRYVLNTHYHFDHSGGNASANALGYPLIGRGPIRELMLERNLEQDPNAAPPEMVINGVSEVWLGERQVQLVAFDGHSGGTDLIAYVPDVDVMVAGDLLFTQRIPYLGDANIRVWQATLEQLAADYGAATLLAGHGPVSDRTDLETLQGYLETLEAMALGWKEQGLSQEEAIAQAELPEQYSDYLFQGLFSGNLEVAYQQITLGNDDAASIQGYFQAQTPALRAL
ncbi:MAG: MBL fold metallo-hydrolase [Elainellaceae cyanobacterium]